MLQVIPRFPLLVNAGYKPCLDDTLAGRRSYDISYPNKDLVVCLLSFLDMHVP